MPDEFETMLGDISEEVEKLAFALGEQRHALRTATSLDTTA